ncbi:YcaO-like family protein [Chitinimonas sp. PSY-7]|uniref:YcaO-like family protein n=1 Tax=Chitinimonas sp. PSY-7 TaxID=3459088 RepID=UPI00403FD233
MDSVSNSEYQYDGIASSRQVKIEPYAVTSSGLLIGRTAIRIRSADNSLYQLTGASLGIDEASTRLRAFAELVERLSAFQSQFTAEVINRSYTTFDDLNDACAIKPSSLQHFKALPELLLDSRNPDTCSLSWVIGRRVLTESPVWVPALAAFLWWKVKENDCLFLWPSATGLAAGTEIEAAEMHGLLEVVERDVCMLSWRVPGFPLYRLSAEELPDYLQEELLRHQLVVNLYIYSQANFPSVVISMMTRTDGSALTCGSAAGFKIAHIAEKAVLESLMLRWTIAREPNTSVFEDALPTNSFGHVLYAYHHPKPILDWYSNACIGDFKPEPQCIFSKKGIISAVEEEYGSSVVSVDLTTAQARKSGWCVVRVVVANALPRETDHRLIHDGGARLMQICDRYNVDYSKINLSPNPFG